MLRFGDCQTLKITSEKGDNHTILHIAYYEENKKIVHVHQRYCYSSLYKATYKKVLKWF